MVERPRARHVSRGELVVGLVVEKPLYGCGRPEHGVAVERVSQWPAQVVRTSRTTVEAAVAGTVKGAVDPVRVDSDILHYVDLTAAGPAGLVDIVTEHPKGRPGSRLGWHLDPSLDAAVTRSHPVFGDDARAGNAPIVSRRAVMARLPSPVRAALLVELV